MRRFISCPCLTYGRNEYLEEAIEFFLRQDYAGRKELVIVNDLPEQTLVFRHPEVRVINLPARCATLGDKRNLAVSECRGDVIVCWDDDDGYLPHHLTACASYIAGYDYARPNRCFVWTGRDRMERVAGSFIAQHVFTRPAFERAGGYPPMNSGQDMVLDHSLQRVSRCNWPAIDPHEITYLFRWGNGDYHLSGYHRDREGQPSGYDIIGRTVNRGLAERRLEAGTLYLTPHFRFDYARMVRRFWEAQCR